MKKTLLIIGISFLAGLLLAGYVFVILPENKDKNSNWEDPAPSAVASPLYAAQNPQIQPGLDFTAIAEKVGPAVVKIEADKVETRRVSGFFDESPFDDFWDRFFGTPREREQEFRSRSGGTGFFISADGYILTNNHIVENAFKVKVSTLLGNEYTADIIGTDSKTDLALLKIKGDDFPFARLGDSANLQVGEWVLAIGNPATFGHTVTAGIVSAKGRQLSGMIDLPYQDFIQTDAAINRGNSGGPLVNTNAEVIGITSIIYTPTGGNIGIGFAIPSDLAKKIVKQLKENGKVVRGYLGVTMTNDINDELKDLLNLKSKKGALIDSVTPGTPADRAGLKTYDVIIEINGLPVENKNDLLFKIADIKPDTKVELVVIRDGKEMTFSVKLATVEDEGIQGTQASSEDDIGYTVQDLTPAIAQRNGFTTQEGVIISIVSRYSEAEEKGIQRGDIILEVNRQSVKDVGEFNRIIRKLNKGQPYLLLLSRERRGIQPQEFIVTLRIPE